MKRFFTSLFSSRRMVWIGQGGMHELRMAPIFLWLVALVMMGLAMGSMLYIKRQKTLDDTRVELAQLHQQHIQLSGHVVQMQREIATLDNFLARSSIVGFNREDAPETIVKTPTEIIPSLAAIAAGLERALISLQVPLEDVRFATVHQNDADVTKMVTSFKANGARGGEYMAGKDMPHTLETQRFLQRYVEVLEHTIEEMPIAKPMKEKYKRTSGFGPRSDPFRRRVSMHNGADFVGSKNTPIYATADGKVSFAGRKNAYGNIVMIDHGGNLETRYAHLSKVKTKKGKKVKRGDVIGYQGSTGRSTGQHLHYEVRHRKTPLDPDIFLQVGSYFYD